MADTPSLREVPGATTAFVVVLIAAALALFGWTWTHTLPASTLPSTRTPAAQTSADPDVYAAALRTAVNDERRRARLAPLTEASCADAPAAERADLLIGQRLEHAPLEPLRQACPGAVVVRENLSRAAAPPQAAVNAWMASALQRAEILDPALTLTAVACTHDGDEMLCVQLLLGTG